MLCKSSILLIFLLFWLLLSWLGIGSIWLFPALFDFVDSLDLLLLGGWGFDSNIFTLDRSIGLCVFDQGGLFSLLDLSLLLLKLSLLLLHLSLLRNLFQQLVGSSDIRHSLVLVLSDVFCRNN